MSAAIRFGHPTEPVVINPTAMKLNQLQDVVAIVQHGSLSAAARRLEVPQPALTRSVRALERELGVLLFEREARGMKLTALGELFHRRASAVVTELTRARDELAQAQGSDTGELTAGLSIMPHVGMLPQALPVFRQRYPGVKLRLIEGLFPDLERRLRAGTIDFYIGAAPHAAPAPGLLVETLFKNTRAVVARRGHPLQAATSFRALAKSEWATTSIDYNTEDDLRQLFARHRFGQPQVVLRAHTALTLMVGLAHSDLLALLPVQWGAFPLLRDALCTLPLKERIAAPPIVLIRRPDLPLTPAAEHFCDVMRRQGPRSPSPAGPPKPPASTGPASTIAKGRATRAR